MHTTYKYLYIGILPLEYLYTLYTNEERPAAIAQLPNDKWSGARINRNVLQILQNLLVASAVRCEGEDAALYSLALISRSIGKCTHMYMGLGMGMAYTLHTYYVNLRYYTIHAYCMHNNLSYIKIIYPLAELR